MSKVIGIDLGTTNSCVAVMDFNIPKVVENELGIRTTPSVVAFNDDSVIDVGHIAKNRASINSKNTLFAIKRLIGRQYNDPVVEKKKKMVPYSIVEGENGEAWVHAGGANHSPSQIVSHILKKMKVAAENFLQDEVNQAVVTVPAYFNNAQRKATIDAGKIAGLEVLRLINEPTAAALAFGYKKNDGKTIVVFDFGGGTFDVSILEIKNGIFKVKSTNGNTFLGGEDIDMRLVDYFVDEFKKENNIDLRNENLALQRLKNAAEKAKIELSIVEKTEVIETFISANTDGPKHLNMVLTRLKLEHLVDDIIHKTIGPCIEAMENAKLSKEDIDDVVLVGGMTRMPKIQDIVKELFDKEPNKSVNPDEVVALGAAIQAGMINYEVKDMTLLDVNSLTLGIALKGGRFSPIIEKNTPIPAKVTARYTTSDDYQTTLGIRVFQGESEIVANNSLIGTLILDGIPAAPEGEQKIEVTFDHDKNGIVNVSAKILETGVERKIQIQRPKYNNLQLI